MKKEQKLCKDWFQELQNTICTSITDIEKDFGSRSKFKKNNLVGQLLCQDDA